MKLIFILLSLGFISSCSTSHERRSLSERIQAEEVRSLQEIKSHIGFLLESHPELDKATKLKLGALLNITISKQQALKEEELKIFQLLLSESLRINHLTAREVKDKNDLVIRLKEVYEERSENVQTLINKIVHLSEQKVLSDSFRHDMMDFIRDAR
jgi:hypothetical protein